MKPTLSRPVAVLLILLFAGLAAPVATGAPAAPTVARSEAASAAPAAFQEQHLYRTLMLRAAPGELAAVIEMIKARMPAWETANEVGPFWMRHSQGDQWDLLLLFHMGRGFDEYFSDASRTRRQRAWRAAGSSDAEFEQELLPRISWREELFVFGPPPEVVADRFDGAGFFHVEIFLAVAGKRGELLRQREMENVYLEGIGRDPNLIFSRAAGAAWDSYTIGFYRDLKHYAESADISDEAEERAAVAAGFESASTIGTYLRELISQHHDTLAGAIR